MEALTDDTTMTRPQRARIILGTTRFATRQVAVRFVSTTAAKSSSDIRTSRPSRVIPAHATSTSTAPSCRSEEHTSELQSLMRISYAVFCLKNKNTNTTNNTITQT